MRNIGMFFKIERCETPVIRTPSAVWPAMRTPRCKIASDVGRAMQTTKFRTLVKLEIYVVMVLDVLKAQLPNRP